jgi:hypothetical protein
MRTYTTGELLDLVEQVQGNWVTVKSVLPDGVGTRHLRKSGLGWFWQVGPDLDPTMVLRTEFQALHENGLWVVTCIGILAHDYDDFEFGRYTPTLPPKLRAFGNSPGRPKGKLRTKALLLGR